MATSDHDQYEPLSESTDKVSKSIRRWKYLFWGGLLAAVIGAYFAATVVVSNDSVDDALLAAVVFVTGAMMFIVGLFVALVAGAARLLKERSR